MISNADINQTPSKTPNNLMQCEWHSVQYIQMLYDGHTSLLKQAGFILPMLSTQRAIEPCWQRHTKKTRTCVFASNYMMLLQTPVWQFDPLRVGQNKIWLRPGYKAKKTQTKCHINTKIRIHQLFGRRKSFLYIILSMKSVAVSFEKGCGF